jgi:hypothetical protein
MSIGTYLVNAACVYAALPFTLIVVDCMLTLDGQGLGNGRHGDAIGLFARTPCPKRRPICLYRPKAEYDLHMVELTRSGEHAKLYYGSAEYHTE